MVSPLHCFPLPDDTGADREKKLLEQAKKRALSSSIIRELKEQYSDAPEEIREGRYPHASRQSREDEYRLVVREGRELIIWDGFWKTGV